MGTYSFTAPNQPIVFANICYTGKRKIATKFVKQITCPIPIRQNPVTRRILRQIQEKHKLNHSAKPFTPDQVRKALEESGSSTAFSPENFTIRQPKHLGPLALRYLTKIFNLSYAD